MGFCPPALPDFWPEQTSLETGRFFCIQENWYAPGRKRQRMQGRISSAVKRMEPEMKIGSGSRNLKQEKNWQGKYQRSFNA